MSSLGEPKRLCKMCPDLSTLNPITAFVPDCAIPLLLETQAKDFPYAFSGSGILASYGPRAVIITAEHCLGKTPEQVKASIESLRVPISTSSRELFPLKEWASAVALDNVSKELLPDGRLDIVVITIDQTDPTIVDAFAHRCVKLPGEGKWIETLERSLAADNNGEPKNILLEARGFPLNGTNSAIDPESKHIVTQGVTYRGKVTWNKSFPHTLELSINPNDCPVHDLNGCSGGPIFMPMPAPGGGYQYALAGMMVRASGSLGHFVTVRWLVEAVTKALIAKPIVRT